MEERPLYLSASEEVLLEKRILVDMTCSLLHHGHIRILEKAANLGSVIVALTTDKEIEVNKGFIPELNYSQREEILLAIKYVDEVVPSKWLIEDDFIRENKIDLLVHGDDYASNVTACPIKIFPRTEGISSSLIRMINN